LGCSVSPSRRKEKGRAYLEDAFIAGKGLGEDKTNRAAARPVVAAGEGRGVISGRRVREKALRNRGRWNRGMALSGGALSGSRDGCQ